MGFNSAFKGVNTDQFSVTSSTNTTAARNWETETTQRHCSGRAISCCITRPSSVCRLFTKWMEVTAFTHEEQMQLYLVSNIEQTTRSGRPYCKLCEMLTTLESTRSTRRKILPGLRVWIITRPKPRWPRGEIILKLIFNKWCRCM